MSLEDAREHARRRRGDSGIAGLPGVEVGVSEHDAVVFSSMMVVATSGSFHWDPATDIQRASGTQVDTNLDMVPEFDFGALAVALIANPNADAAAVVCSAALIQMEGSEVTPAPDAPTSPPSLAVGVATGVVAEVQRQQTEDAEYDQQARMAQRATAPEEEEEEPASESTRRTRSAHTQQRRLRSSVALYFDDEAAESENEGGNSDEPGDGDFSDDQQ